MQHNSCMFILNAVSTSQHVMEIIMHAIIDKFYSELWNHLSFNTPVSIEYFVYKTQQWCHRFANIFDYDPDYR